MGVYNKLRLIDNQKVEQMKKSYGVTLKAKTEKQKPVPMTLSNKEGSRVVLSAAKRVITTHSKVIKALASR